MNGRLKLVLIAGVLGAVAIAATVAIAGGNRDIRERLSGYEEDPSTISTTGRGSFHASIDRSGKRIFYKLRYSDTESPVTQAHIHFGGRHQSGGISVFLCSNLTTPAPPPGTDPCPNPSGSVSGVIEADDVIGPGGQGIASGQIDELLAALRAGVTYVNVHTMGYPLGEIRAQIDHDGHNRGR